MEGNKGNMDFKMILKKISSQIRNKKTLIYIGLGAACVIAIFAIIMVVRHAKDNIVVAEEEENVIQYEDVDIAHVRHYSFGPLCLYDTEGYLSVNDFSQILGTLYNNGYVLVDIESIVKTDEEGNMSLVDTINIPEGRKPLILSQRDVSYALDRQNSSFARKLVVDGTGELANEYVDDYEQTALGSFDMIPIVEDFIKSHPDFSIDGARGIIGVTGYNGVLGYRTSAYLAEAQNNPYGVFDVQNERNMADAVITKLKSKGWKFASNGFDGISYGNEYSRVEADILKWNEQVAPVVGESAMIIYPMGTDIGSWAPYTQSNAKYILLNSLGFKYYFIDEKDTPELIQVEKDFAREAIIEVNSFEDFQNTFEG